MTTTDSENEATDALAMKDASKSNEQAEDENINKKEEIEFHQLLKYHIGEFRCYQILFVLHKTWSTFVAALFTFLPVFIATIPEHRCDIPIESDINCTEEVLIGKLIPREVRHGKELPAQCEYYSINDTLFNNNNCTLGNSSVAQFSITKCDRWVYSDSVFKTTIISEWDIVCSRAYLAAHANSVYWVGVMVGLLFGGHLADRYGRKPVGLFGYAFFLITGMASAFSPNYMVFLVLRCLSALFKTVKEIGEGIAALESIGKSWRLSYFVGDLIGWCAGYFVMDLLAYYERRWRYLQAYIALPDIPALLLFILYVLFYSWVYRKTPIII